MILDLLGPPFEDLFREFSNNISSAETDRVFVDLLY